MVLKRGMKRSVIGFIYFMSATLLITGVYFGFLKAPETCFDGRENQNEEAIDCGGICQAVCKENVIGESLQFTEQVFVPGDNGKYDVLGKVRNPNDVEGASVFSYTATLKDSWGNVLATRQGESYILPQESKYILLVNIETTAPPVTVDFVVDDVEWERFSGYQEKPSINIYQKRYGPISSGAGFSEAYGLLSNESPYDFRAITVRVILRDASDKPLAFNMTEMRTVKSHEERDFRLVWPSAFLGTVEKVEMEVDADVYHSDNFMHQFLPGGKFQDFTPSGY